MRFLLPICKFLSFRKKWNVVWFEQTHQRNRSCRELKSNDKKKAEEDNSSMLRFRRSLLTPKCQESSMYCRKKLCTNNLTIYDLGTIDGFCYDCHEGMDSRGPCGIATCVFMYLKHLALRGVRDVVLYFDNCGGLNRNRFFLTYSGST